MIVLLPDHPVPHDSDALQVKAVYTDVLYPYPKEITQLEDQLIVYETSLLAPSPYKTVKQTTILKLASSRVGLPHTRQSLASLVELPRGIILLSRPDKISFHTPRFSIY